MARLIPSFHGIESSPGPLCLEDRLVFLHFEKTAGITIHSCLAPLFNGSEIFPHRGSGIADWPSKSLQRWRFFSMHAKLRDFRFIPKPIKIITFLRNPIHRCISLYEYWSSYTDEAIEINNLHGPRLAKSMSIEEFYSTDKFDLTNYIWNSYTMSLIGDRVLSPYGRLWESTEEILEHALKNLDAMAFVGITEDLTTSFDRMSKQLDIPNNYHGQIENETKSNYQRDSSFEEIHELVITDEMLNIISQSNSLDMVLYKHVAERFYGQNNMRQNVVCIPAVSHGGRIRVGRCETWVQNSGGGFILFGPYMRLLPSRYKVEFRFRFVHGAPNLLDDSFGFVDVVARKGETILGRAELNAGIILSNGGKMEVQFHVSSTVNDVEFRVFAKPDIQVEVAPDVTISYAFTCAATIGQVEGGFRRV